MSSARRMPRKKKFDRRKALIIGVSALIVVTISIIIAIFSGGKSAASSSFGAGRPTASSAVTPMAVYHPPTARQVADTLGCKNFEQHNVDGVSGSTDAGACMMGAEVPDRHLRRVQIGELMQIILISALAVCLTACGHHLDHGIVVGKQYSAPYTYLEMVCASYNNSGSCTVSVN